MPSESVAIAAGKPVQRVAGATLPTSPLRRSRLATNPHKAHSRRTTQGRYILDLAARWLKLVTTSDPNDVLTIAAVISAAELSYRCDTKRRDPDASDLALVRMENLLARKLRSLGIISKDRLRRGGGAIPPLAEMAQNARASGGRS